MAASTISGSGGGGSGGGASASAATNAMSMAASATMQAVSTSVVDPSSLLNQQLAAALSTMGDAQYWEESISPNQIRTDLEKVSDPVTTSHSHIQQQIRCMKWLLANISKGRDVSDFYPYVIKLVGAVSLEVRKMVYMFTVQYANHNQDTRELSLLSINAFQRGLGDPEQLIRGLALRVLTSVHIMDIIQIQILAVQTCAADISPYVRKCAANAIAKLAPRISADDLSTRTLLMDIIQNLLDKDNSTMVLTSALTSFSELMIANQWNTTNNNNNNKDADDISSSSSSSSSTSSNNSHQNNKNIDPLELYRLHRCYRKICHLLTDMDEWGQVIVIDLMARYCRQYFKKPINMTEGTAERIDKQRRVRRPKIQLGIIKKSSGGSSSITATATTRTSNSLNASTMTAATTTVTLPPRNPNARKVKRRVIKKGFYSDEEDESTEEEVFLEPNNNNNNNNNTERIQQAENGPDGTRQRTLSNMDNEDSELASDHRLLLSSAMPLLKSRNAGVVLAVCSLHYYCGVASVQVRAAMGKALVRIVHTAKQDNRREIQYVILSSIRQLVSVCPSAFAPYMHDFFVNPTQDPPFTRRIKLDILVQLALEPSAIDTVLRELRTYVQLPMIAMNQGGYDDMMYDNNNDDDYYDGYGKNDDDDTDIDDDTQFACMSIRAVGRVAEMTRIVFQRHAATSTSSTVDSDYAEANRIALNCLYGLVTLSETADRIPPILVGETVVVMQQILHMLLSVEITSEDIPLNNTDEKRKRNQSKPVYDPNHVQERAFGRVVLLLIHTLNALYSTATEGDIQNDDDDQVDDNSSSDRNPNMTRLERLCGSTVLPARATVCAIWIVGSILAPYSVDDEIYKAAFGNLWSSSKSMSSPSGSSAVNPRAQVRLEISRLLSRAFVELTAGEKEQAIHFATRILVSNRDDPTKFSLQEVAVCEHILSMGRVDVHPDVRDRARFESNVIHMSIGLQYDTDGMDDITNNGVNGGISSDLVQITDPVVQTNLSNKSMLSLQKVKGIFLRSKPASSSLPLASEDMTVTPSSELGDGGFRFGTLSSLVGHRARSSYLPLPQWAKENSPDSLREPPPERMSIANQVKPPAYPSAASAGKERRESTQKQSGEDFYDANASSDSSSDSDSDSDAELSSSSDSSESSESSSTSAERVQRGRVPDEMGMMTGLSGPTLLPLQQKLSAVQVESASDDSSSSSDSDNSAADRKHEQPQLLQEVLFPKAHGMEETLLPMANQERKQFNVQSTAYAASDMLGLTLPTTAGDFGAEGANLDFGAWIHLIRPEHSSGLSVQVRYVRGATKAQQVQLMGLTADKPTTVCAQVRFENTKADKDLYRIRIFQRSSTASSSSGSTIGPRKVVCPPEINQLGAGQKLDCFLGIDFASASDREGSLVAKLEVKCGVGGSMPVEIKPPIGDLLLPCMRSIQEFDKTIARMQGFQRIESKFAVAESLRSEIPKRILSQAALCPVVDGRSRTLQWQDDQLRLAGTLPASMDPVFVVVKCDSSGAGQIIVCCDHALAVNSLMNVLKKAVTE